MAEYSLLNLVSVATATWAFGIINGWVLHLYSLNRSMLGPEPKAWAECSTLYGGELFVEISIQNNRKIPIYLVEVYSSELEFAEIVPIFVLDDASDFSGVRHTGKWKSKSVRNVDIAPSGKESICLAAKNGSDPAQVRAKLVRAKGHPAPNAYRVCVKYS
ncbi:MAG: hypothetical protein KKF77_13385 [Proteobacteria bacterium]|nr:hypothetical protein [Pseudomonadota bacterium]